MNAAPSNTSRSLLAAVLLLGWAASVPAQTPPFLSADAVMAGDGSIHIQAPKEGARLASGSELLITLDTQWGEKGQYVEIAIDGERACLLSRGETECPVTGLDSGTHRIEARLLNHAHAGLGTRSEVTVSVAAEGATE